MIVKYNFKRISEFNLKRYFYMTIDEIYKTIVAFKNGFSVINLNQEFYKFKVEIDDDKKEIFYLTPEKVPYIRTVTYSQSASKSFLDDNFHRYNFRSIHMTTKYNSLKSEELFYDIDDISQRKFDRALICLKIEYDSEMFDRIIKMTPGQSYDQDPLLKDNYKILVDNFICKKYKTLEDLSLEITITKPKNIFDTSIYKKLCDKKDSINNDFNVDNYNITSIKQNNEILEYHFLSNLKMHSYLFYEFKCNRALNCNQFTNYVNSFMMGAAYLRGKATRASFFPIVLYSSDETGFYCTFSYAQSMMYNDFILIYKTMEFRFNNAKDKYEICNKIDYIKDIKPFLCETFIRNYFNKIIFNDCLSEFLFLILNKNIKYKATQYAEKLEQIYKNFTEEEQDKRFNMIQKILTDLKIYHYNSNPKKQFFNKVSILFLIKNHCILRKKDIECLRFRNKLVHDGKIDDKEDDEKNEMRNKIINEIIKEIKKTYDHDKNEYLNEDELVLMYVYSFFEELVKKLILVECDCHILEKILQSNSHNYRDIIDDICENIEKSNT